MNDIAIRADSCEVRRAASWLERLGVARGIPEEPRFRLDLCVHEALANIIEHGGEAARKAPITLQFRVSNRNGDSEALVTVSDSGQSFDPVGFAVKATPRSLAETEPGGLGLAMIRNFADTVGYAHLDGRNHLTVGVQWSAAIR